MIRLSLMWIGLFSSEFQLAGRLLLGFVYFYKRNEGINCFYASTKYQTIIITVV